MNLRTLTNEELIRAVLNNEHFTELEKELATRLAYAIDSIERMEEDGNDS